MDSPRYFNDPVYRAQIDALRKKDAGKQPVYGCDMVSAARAGVERLIKSKEKDTE